MLKRLLVIAMTAALAAGMSYAEQAKTITIPVTKTGATNGRVMYGSYCAPCHGVDGRGQGPVAFALKVPPPDLTLLSRNNHGKFPDSRVVVVLQSGTDIKAHGTAEMPVWGPILGKMNLNNPQERLLRISNLSRYLESLQVK
ncbi:MAG: c-type cytochrome [Terracidiphilus sp.]|jgi:mono/diheme cytochrome c family protein